MQSAAKNFDPKTSKVGKSAEEVTYFKCSKVSCSTKTVTSNDKKPFAYVIRYFSTFPCHIRNKPWRWQNQTKNIIVGRKLGYSKYHKTKSNVKFG